jgi:hypothetical protein
MGMLGEQERGRVPAAHLEVVMRRISNRIRGGFANL